MGIRSAISRLEEGPPQTKPDVKLFIPPGLRVDQIAERVGELPGLDAQKFLDVVNSGEIKSKYQPAGVTSLEGLLFPDTYLVGADWDEKQVAQLLVNQFDTIADKVGLANATQQGLTPYQVVVIASLIQTETKITEEGPSVAAVIHNRLQQNMALQIDYTLCYARKQITGTGCPPPPNDSDKTLDSPYNTYEHTGLPPTPIASVTEASLAAALSPANVPYLYYVVADADGHHAFATTLAEHEANVEAAREKGLL
jgi:UPF0755 protein